MVGGVEIWSNQNSHAQCSNSQEGLSQLGRLLWGERGLSLTLGSSAKGTSTRKWAPITTGWVPKNWCIWTVVLEKILESPLGCKAIQTVHSKDQSWVFIGRTNAEAENLILWPPDAKSWLIGKDPDAEKDWGQEEKGTTEDEMAGWHHGLDGHGFGWTPGVGDGQGGLACCDSWVRKELDTTEPLNWTDAKGEAPVLWPPDVKSWLIGKDPDAGKHWRQGEKRATGNDMVGWHHWLNGHEFEKTPGDSDRQGSLVCCSPWGHKESDTT